MKSALSPLRLSTWVALILALSNGRAHAATITLNNGDTQNYTPTSTAASGAVDTRTFGSQAVPDTSLIPFGGTADSVGTSTDLTIPAQPVATGTQLVGQLQITTGGAYTFATNSDDGSRLFIDGVLVVNNEGNHGLTNLNNTVTLDAGLHEIRVEIVNNSAGGSLAVTYSGPDQPTTGVIPASSLFRAENAASVSTTVAPNTVVGLGDDIAVTAGASAAVNLLGTAFSNAGLDGLNLGVGSTLTVTGTANRDLRSASTTFNGAGSYTLDTAPDLALGIVSGTASATTLVKLGSGRLILDNASATANDFTGTTIDVQAGELYVIGSSAAGATNPLGTATVQLNGTTLALDTAVGDVSFDNTIVLAGTGGTLQGVSGPREVGIGSATAINIGTTQTLNLNTFSGSNVASGAVLVVNSPLTGDGAVTKTETSAGSGNQAGIAALAGDSPSYSGTLTAQAGTLEGRFSSAGAKAFGTGGVVLNGGNLSLRGLDAGTGVNYTPGNIVQADANATVSFGAGTGGGDGGTFALGALTTTGTRTLTFTGSEGHSLALAGTTLGGNATLNVTAGTVNTGNVAESAASNLIKGGAGTLVLGGTGTYTGTTTINGGVLEAPTLSDSSPSSVGTADVTLNGGTFRYTGLVDATTTREFNANNGNGGGIDVADPGATLTLDGVTRGNGSSALTKSGPGTLVLGGAADNPSLILNATEGVTELNKSVAGGTRAVAGISAIAPGATVRLTGAGTDQIFGGTNAAQTGSVNLTGGTLDLNGSSEGINRLDGVGVVTNNGGSSTTSTLTVGEANGSGAFSGSLRDGTGGGKVALEKVGNGVQTIGFNSDGLTNTYTGGTTISGGTLRLEATPLAPVSGSQLWLDAADSSTLTTTGAAQSVVTWADKSGNGRDAGQSTTSARPTAGTNAGLGGLGVVTFDGANDALEVDLTFLANSGYTIFALEGRTENSQAYFLGTTNVTGAPFTNKRLHVGYFDQDTFRQAQFSNDTNYNDAGLIYDGSNQVFRQWTLNSDSTTGQTIRLNGTEEASDVNKTAPLSEVNQGFVGRGFGTGDQFYTGDIGEILIYNRTLTARELAINDAYLENKWFGGTSFTTSDLLPTTTAVNITASGAALDLNGVDQQIGSLDGVAGSAVTLGSADLTVGNASDAAFAGNISGAGGLTKVGTGSQTLSGTGSYAGPTLVNTGTLAVNGDFSAATGPVTVAAGATLGGSGTLGGATTILGQHSPGNSPGLQSFAAGLTYDGGASTVLWELTDNSTSGRGSLFDGIDVTGPLDFAGATAFSLAFNNGSLVDWSDALWGSDQSWLLWNVTGTTTGFGNLSLVPDNWADGQGDLFNSVLASSVFSLRQDGSNVFLDYGAIPEPSRALLMLIGLTALIARRRRR